MRHHFVIFHTNAPEKVNQDEILKLLNINPNEYELMHFTLKELKVAQAKDLAYKASFKSDKPSVFIVKFDFITQSAQDALLKTLEEAKNTLFVFVVPNDLVFKDTLVSRAEVKHLKSSSIDLSDLQAVFKLPPKDRLTNKLIKKIINAKDTHLAREFVLQLFDLASMQDSQWKKKFGSQILDLLKMSQYIFTFDSFQKNIIEALIILFPRIERRNI